MPYVLRLATPEGRTLVVEALRAAASQRTRVATRAAGEVAKAKAAGREVRSQAVKVTMLLAEASELGTYADDLEAAADVPVVTRAGLVAEALAEDEANPGIPDEADTPPEDVDTAPDDGEDGTSQQARHLAELAGLTPADPDAVEDPVTGALPEDEPDTPEEIDLR